MTRLAITAGAGIGGEVILKALCDLGPSIASEVHCYGTIDYWRRSGKRYYDSLSAWVRVHAVNAGSTGGTGPPAVACLTQAVDAIQAGHADALVTGPVAKAMLQTPGKPGIGHTEWLAAKTGCPEVSMGFWSPDLVIVLATVHCPLRDVPDRITPALLNLRLTHALKLCQSLGIQRPRIAIAGLNPHAGESGLIGSDESVIHTVVQTWQADTARVAVSGPYPPDTVFRQAAIDKQFDCVLALYHDQGLIPIKLLAFESAVNITIGLPFIRTSPDHGTADDIVFQDKADPRSMIAAIRLASRLAQSP